ncbi:unnamed protein product [Caenorhabditis auriculariae]|uniref:Uncharacterized protein n=1 Tax=Caenorhabditis auriculariae TaxID=2777116 RepID=A0A8S1H394_9PELO|nr:unnamed protein product [Caenorhabditis auriculariae]
MASTRFVLLILVALVATSAAFSSCEAGRGACVASCIAQNCGTGYCEHRGGRATCVCSRCGQGGQNIPGGK